MVIATLERQLLRARDLADARYSERLTVDEMAKAAALSRSHFIEKFRQAFGVTPHAYLLTRRLERAAVLLRRTDYSVAWICMLVGLRSVGSFTTSFKRAHGLTPASYRKAHPPATSRVQPPACVVRAYGRPRHRTFREDDAAGPAYSASA